MTKAVITVITATTKMPSQTMVAARLRRGRRRWSCEDPAACQSSRSSSPKTRVAGSGPASWIRTRLTTVLRRPRSSIDAAYSTIDAVKLLRALPVSKWKLLYAAGLVALSVVLYLLQWAVFQNGRSTLFYLLQDIAFLPISILVVTVIVAEAVAWRDREALLHKLNMVIGVFFSEVGNDLLRLLVAFDHAAADLSVPLHMDDDWDKARFTAARSWLAARPCACDARAGDLQAVADLLRDRREFLLRLIENPSLLEHQSFTELMWAVLHVGEEFTARGGAEGSRKPTSTISPGISDGRTACCCANGSGTCSTCGQTTRICTRWPCAPARCSACEARGAAEGRTRRGRWRAGDRRDEGA